MGDTLTHFSDPLSLHRGRQEPEAAAAQHHQAEEGDQRTDRAGRRREGDRDQAGSGVEEGVRQDRGQNGQGQHHAAAQDAQAQEGAEEEVEGRLEEPHREGGQGHPGTPEEAQREHQEEAGRQEEEQAEEDGETGPNHSGILKCWENIYGGWKLRKNTLCVAVLFGF